MIDPSELAAEASQKLREAGVAAFVQWVRETGSTNDDAKLAAASGSPVPAVFVADSQTRGRGRSGNAWVSASGEGLLFSVVFRPKLRPDATAPVTLAAGAAIASVLDRHVPGRCKVKWPNDVELDGKKVAGILVEGQTRGPSLEALVVGVGINVSAVELLPEVAATATSLALAGAEIARVDLLVEAVSALSSAIARFAESGIRSFLEQIRSMDALMGQGICVDGVSGIASGIDDSGKLLIRDSEGNWHACVSGHVARFRT